MCGYVSVYVSRELKPVFDYCKQHSKAKTNAEVLRMALMKFKEFSESDRGTVSLKQVEEEIEGLDLKKLEKLFNDMADRDKKSLKEKKNASWGYERFFNDMYDLYIHRAPVQEWIVTAQHYHKLMTIVNAMHKKKGEQYYTWDDVHRKAARIRPNDYLMEHVKRKFK